MKYETIICYLEVICDANSGHAIEIRIYWQN